MQLRFTRLRSTRLLLPSSTAAGQQDGTRRYTEQGGMGKPSPRLDEGLHQLNWKKYFDLKIASGSLIVIALDLLGVLLFTSEREMALHCMSE